jgi:hypothetical protein
VVAALRKNEELRDHPTTPPLPLTRLLLGARRPGCDCNVTRISDGIDRRLCVSQPHLPCRAWCVAWRCLKMKTRD